MVGGKIAVNKVAILYFRTSERLNKCGLSVCLQKDLLYTFSGFLR